VRGVSDNFLWQKSLLSGVWYDWTALGGTLTGDPGACESPTQDATDILVLGNDANAGAPANGLWQKSWR
jgi:hypothetical protein